MQKVGVLIDFDNIFPKLISEYTNNEIDRAITKVIDKVKQDYLTVDMIDIRLYGGWYTGNTFTPRASSLGAMLPSLNSKFPILENQLRRINGFVSLGYVRGQVPDTGGRYMPPEADYLLCSLDDSSVYAC